MNISILGCGWLGLALAELLVSEGYQVKGSTTSDNKLSMLGEKNIEPYLLKFSPGLNKNNDSGFWNSKILILNIPPGRNNGDPKSYHLKQIENITGRLNDSPIAFVIFISSTSVYPAMGGVLDESDAESGKASRPTGEALIKAEKILSNESSFETTILRCGGLYGYDRHPVKYLAGREKLDRARAPVNLIHRDDCVEIIRQIIENDLRGEVFNAVSDGHPPREQYYVEAAKEKGLDPPDFKADTRENYKIVSNKKLKEKLNYTFKYPNPMNFYAP